MVSGGDERFKDNVTGRLVPEVVSECSLVRKGSIKGTCLSDEAIKILGEKAGIPINVPEEQVIVEIRKRYGTNDDKDLIGYLPKDHATRELMYFKVSGPEGVSLLSNEDIDAILRQWTTMFPDFYPYSFNMLNYTEYSFRHGRVVREPDTLATVNPEELFRKYKTCGCIINSDVYQGHGKHWMALFADTRSRPCTVEFFNSSGRSPAPEWTSWMQRVQLAISRIHGIPEKEVQVITSNRVQQYSMTECGVYSLFYIWSRLNGVPAKYFNENDIHDELMFEFRAHLFSGYNQESKTWSYDIFKKDTKVRWDSSGGHREGEP